MTEYIALDPPQLERFLLRRRATLNFPSESSLGENLLEILRKANEFVPSAAGSILLDHPLRKAPDRRENELHFIAAFGWPADQLLGETVPADQGIAGRVYVTGHSYLAADASTDTHFFAGVDEKTKYHTESLVAIPIRIEKDVCGVLELINRQGAPSFTERDLQLLEIFASYISVSIENVLDARHAHEIARRDNLTGLFNDRYLHIGLSQFIEECQETQEDLSILFLDLDNFKDVNDTHGHLAGSQVLRELGWELRDILDRPRGLAARYGGDEFVLTVAGIGLEEALELAESIRKRVAQKVFITSPGDLHSAALHLKGITCSLGIATLHRHVPGGLDTEAVKSALLRNADTAMYLAKEGGRDCTRVAPEDSMAEDAALGRSYLTTD